MPHNKTHIFFLLYYAYTWLFVYFCWNNDVVASGKRRYITVLNSKYNKYFTMLYWIVETVNCRFKCVYISLLTTGKNKIINWTKHNTQQFNTCEKHNVNIKLNMLTISVEYLALFQCLTLNIDSRLIYFVEFCNKL